MKSDFVGVEMVLEVNADAMKRGALPIWTVYDRPSDHPEGYMARRHEVLAGKERATLDTLTADLEGLRDIFLTAGLTRLDRHPEDEPHIVECWI